MALRTNLTFFIKSLSTELYYTARFNSGHEIKLGVMEALINQVLLQVVNNLCVKLCHSKPEVLCTNRVITDWSKLIPKK